MAKSPDVSKGQFEKASAGWFGGANTNRLPWLIPDTEYVWGENIVNRGGVIQTRPGVKTSLTVPGQNPQGCVLFKINNPDYTGTMNQEVMVLAIDGLIYAVPYPWITPNNLNYAPYLLSGLSFEPDANQIIFCIAKQSATLSTSGDIVIVPTYNVLMIQDGISPAGYYDGVNNGQLNEDSPALQTPRGTWMAFSGDRLWVARGSTLLAGDIGNPLSFTERLNTGQGLAGDFQYDDDITALANSQGQSNQSALIVWTTRTTNSIQSQITDRSLWASTTTFQQVIYPSLGCIAGKSITNNNGLLYWYSAAGLVNSDSAARYYLTSEIHYQDTKMARCKQNLAPDLYGVCTASFENYLMVSVPFGDTLNANTMVLDAQIEDISGIATPIYSWQGVWTGFRPVEWTADYLQNQYRIFFLSLDYQSSNGSFIHLWEAFLPERYDSYEYTDTNNVLQLAQNPIYCSWESKQWGDLMDLKKFQYAEVDATEIGGVVNFKMSYAGQKGSFKQLLLTQINAQIDTTGVTNTQAILLYQRLGTLRKQYRRLVGEDAPENLPRTQYEIESNITENIDKAFSLYLQWCGQMAIQAVRIFANSWAENSRGVPTPAAPESTVNMLSVPGVPFQFDQTVIQSTAQNPQTASGTVGTIGFEPNVQAFLSAFSQRYLTVFYSSIPVSWQDLPATAITNLPCCRDSFTPPSRPPILIEGVEIP
jgi:hypothetical protein